jgi:hypothetical protein
MSAYLKGSVMAIGFFTEDRIPDTCIREEKCKKVVTFGIETGLK